MAGPHGFYEWLVPEVLGPEEPPAGLIGQLAEWLERHPDVVTTASFAGNMVTIIGIVAAAHGMWAANQHSELLRDIRREIRRKIDAAIIELKNYIHSELMDERVTASYAMAMTAIDLLKDVAILPRDAQVGALNEAKAMATHAYHKINTLPTKQDRASFGPQILFCALTLLGTEIVYTTLIAPTLPHQELSLKDAINNVENISREMITIIPELIKARFGEVEKQVQHHPGTHRLEFGPMPGWYDVWVWYTIDGVEKYLSGIWHFTVSDELSDNEHHARINAVVEATAAERERVLTEYLQQASKKTGGYHDAIEYCKLLRSGTKFDAAYHGLDGKVRFFCRGQYLVYDVTRHEVVNRAERIESKFKGFIGRVDAAFQVLTGLEKGSTYLFQGNICYKYNENYNLYDGYPKLISQRWHHLFDGKGVDAVFQNKTNGRIYFFKGEDFSVYKADALERLTPGYPKKIKNHWVGIWPKDIDTIVNINGRLSIFRDAKFRFCTLATKTSNGTDKKTRNHWPGLNFYNPEALMVAPPFHGDNPGPGRPRLMSFPASIPFSSSSATPSEMLLLDTGLNNDVTSEIIPFNTEPGSSSTSMTASDTAGTSFSNETTLLSIAPNITLFTADTEGGAHDQQHAVVKFER